ncbi:hypothetical protein COB57_04960 [Candidatus Peregrinibacteria bacterium]|nr:MAG: hypothetical protein COB57_04960 [Candidatus Peregrinibacteria bacterium]
MNISMTLIINKHELNIIILCIILTFTSISIDTLRVEYQSSFKNIKKIFDYLNNINYTDQKRYSLNMLKSEYMIMRKALQNNLLNIDLDEISKQDMRKIINTITYL